MSKIDIRLLNIRSIQKNFNELIFYLQAFHYSSALIILTETWRNDTSEFNEIKGYKSFFKSTFKNKASGVAIFVKYELNPEKNSTE